MTLKEIAAELGVSPSTVSRVLNGRDKNFTVKPELRKRILDRVAERDYKPNPMYQSMRKKDNQQIAIFLPSYLEAALEADINAGVDAMNNSLFEVVEKGFVSPDEALFRAIDRKDLKHMFSENDIEYTDVSDEE